MINNDFLALNNLVKRGVKIFLTDKVSVLFSLLAPLIILFLYIMFLGRIQTDNLQSQLEGLEVSGKVLKAVTDGWMLAGVVAVSCITVSFSAQNLMINDSESGVVHDMLVSPVKRIVLSISYFVYNFVVTLAICTVVLGISFIYIAITGWYLSAADAFKIIAILILSVASASLISTLVCSAIHTMSAHSAFIGILSAAIGFFIGAYMPLSVFPKAIQYIVLFLPGTYSAGVLRNLFMRGAVNQIAGISPQAAQGVRDGFSMQLDFFGKTVDEGTMWLIFGLTIIAALIIYIAVQTVKAKRNTLFNPDKIAFKKKFKKGGSKS